MDLSALPAVPKLISEGWVHTGIQDSSLCWGYFFHMLIAMCTLWKNVPEEREESWQMEGNRLLFQTTGGMVNGVVALGEGSSKGQGRD